MGENRLEPKHLLNRTYSNNMKMTTHKQMSPTYELECFCKSLLPLHSSHNCQNLEEHFKSLIKNNLLIFSKTIIYRMFKNFVRVKIIIAQLYPNDCILAKMIQTQNM